MYSLVQTKAYVLDKAEQQTHMWTNVWTIANSFPPLLTKFRLRFFLPRFFLKSKPRFFSPNFFTQFLWTQQFFNHLGTNTFLKMILTKTYWTQMFFAKNVFYLNIFGPKFFSYLNIFRDLFFFQTKNFFRLF